MTLAHGVAHVGQFEGAGCIYDVGSGIALNRVTVTDCHSTFRGGLSSGGAIGTDSTLAMTDSVISNSSTTAENFTPAAGGGAWAAVMVLVNSTISGNQVRAQVSADGYGGFNQTGGGGLYAFGDVTLINSTITGNSAEATNSGEDAHGGGVFARGSVTIIGSTIEGNVADGEGGGLYKSYASSYGDSTTLTIQNSTISGNSAGITGGGIASTRTTTLTNSTVAFNTSALGGGVMLLFTRPPHSIGTLDLESSILAGNTVAMGAPYAADLASDDTLTVSGANNLVIAAEAGIVLPGDTLAADPQLLPLAWNGGPTQTLALAAGSPAIDAGNDVAGLTSDQRGDDYLRTYGAAADIGAFEAQPAGEIIFRNGFDS